MGQISLTFNTNDNTQLQVVNVLSRTINSCPIIWKNIVDKRIQISDNHSKFISSCISDDMLQSLICLSKWKYCQQNSLKYYSTAGQHRGYTGILDIQKHIPKDALPKLKFKLFVTSGRNNKDEMGSLIYGLLNISEIDGTLPTTDECHLLVDTQDGGEIIKDLVFGPIEGYAGTWVPSTTFKTNDSISGNDLLLLGIQYILLID